MHASKCSQTPALLYQQNKVKARPDEHLIIVNLHVVLIEQSNASVIVVVNHRRPYILLSLDHWPIAASNIFSQVVVEIESASANFRATRQAGREYFCDSS